MIILKHCPLLFLTSKSVTLGTECLLIEGVVKKVHAAGQVLPHYNCLMLSPADLWARNQYSFLQDPHVLLTVNSLMVCKSQLWDYSNGIHILSLSTSVMMKIVRLRSWIAPLVW